MKSVDDTLEEQSPLSQRAAAVAAGVVALVAVVAAATYSGLLGGGPDIARLELQGRAVLEAEGERREVSGGTHELAQGTTVELVDGDGVVRVPGGASVELRAGRGEAPDSRLVVGDDLSLLAGDALVSTGDAGLEVEAADVTLSFDPSSAARLARSTGAAVATYRGVVELVSGGRTLEGGVPALRQAAVPASGLLPRRPAPIAIAEDPDPWDRRLLGDAIELGEQLDRRSAGFTASLRGDTASPAAVLADALPELAGEPALRALERDRAPGEHLVGAGIALLAADGGLADRWQSVVDLRDDGADWGIVALDHGAARSELLALLDGAVDRSPVLFASLPVGAGLDPTLLDPATATPSAPGPTGTATDPAGPPPGSGPAPTSPTDPAPAPGPAPAPSPTSPLPSPLPSVTEPLAPVTEPVLEPLRPVTEPVLEPLRPVTEPVLEPLAPVTAPVDRLLGGLLDPVAPSTGGGGGSDPVGEVVGTVGGVLGRP